MFFMDYVINMKGKTAMKKCLQCGKSHNRKKFCSNRCKDLYHNIHNPRGKFAHLKGVAMTKRTNDTDYVEVSIVHYMHPMEDQNFSGEW